MDTFYFVIVCGKKMVVYSMFSTCFIKMYFKYQKLDADQARVKKKKIVLADFLEELDSNSNFSYSL